MELVAYTVLSLAALLHANEDALGIRFNFI